MRIDTITFNYNHEHKEWEVDYQGTVYSFETFLDAATWINFKLFEEK